MTATTIRTKLLPFGVTGVMALAMIAGAGFSDTVVAKPTPNKTAAAAQAALANGQVDKAITLAEALVAASPREPVYRALLAQAYLKAGRIQSAAVTFDDAMKLGDNSAKTALALALSYSGAGRNRDAVAILNDWRDAIPKADLGLAMALAGEPARGSTVLADALRDGENTPKLRQNLAYAYALDGRWREARIMMGQDLSADQIDARISDWAAKTGPEDYQVRVAGLLGAPVRNDNGQPSRLALNSTPMTEQLAVQTAPLESAPQQVALTTPVAELPPVAGAEPTAALANYRPVTAPVATSSFVSSKFAAAFAGSAVAPAPLVDAAGIAFISQPVIQPVPARAFFAPRMVAAVTGNAVKAAAIVPTKAPGTHLVQLGSFFTQQGARRAWGVYAAKNPQLRGYRMTITQAQVRGKTYFRVAAAGINGTQGALSLCGKVKARGMSCFAYAVRNGVGGNAASAIAPKTASAAPRVVPVLARNR